MLGIYLASKLLRLVQSATAHTLCFCFRRSGIERSEVGSRDAFAQVALHLLKRSHLKQENSKRSW